MSVTDFERSDGENIFVGSDPHTEKGNEYYSSYDDTDNAQKNNTFHAGEV